MASSAKETTAALALTELEVYLDCSDEMIVHGTPFGPIDTLKKKWQNLTFPTFPAQDKQDKLKLLQLRFLLNDTLNHSEFDILNTLSDEEMINLRSACQKVASRIETRFKAAIKTNPEMQKRLNAVEQRFEQLDDLKKEKNKANATATTPAPVSGGLFNAAYHAGAAAIGYLRGGSSPQKATNNTATSSSTTDVNQAQPVDAANTTPKENLDDQTPKPLDTPLSDKTETPKSLGNNNSDDNDEVTPTPAPPTSDVKKSNKTEEPAWIHDDIDEIKKQNQAAAEKQKREVEERAKAEERARIEERARTEERARAEENKRVALELEAKQQEARRIEAARQAAIEQKEREQRAMNVMTAEIGAHHMHAYYRLTLDQQAQVRKAYESGIGRSAIPENTLRQLLYNMEA